MVGDNAERDVALGVLAVLNSRDLGDVFHDILNGIDKEEVVNALHYAGETLKTHARIDVRVVERSVVAVAVVLELGKYEVPDLNKAVALAADVTVGLAAAVFVAAVKVDFGAGTAGT